jgi:hypothetical protein
LIFVKASHGELQNFDIRVISAKGTPHVLNITNLPIVIEQEVIGVHVIGKNMTTLTNTEKERDGITAGFRIYWRASEMVLLL